ncbi:hypothetical protein F2Q69_00020582 [Brassica cretica]|uniref:Uncharacterized protein n=1 Tax=Brassica cretica TaxID=69181 RepID=A0A8S9QM40_BRACR|nr:hypothetical protein F2Q69_00020582 [Brassica cretica]
MSLGASAYRPNDLLKSLHGGRYDTWTRFRMFDSSSRSDHTMSIGMSLRARVFTPNDPS